MPLVMKGEMFVEVIGHNQLQHSVTKPFQTLIVTPENRVLVANLYQYEWLNGYLKSLPGPELQLRHKIHALLIENITVVTELR